MRTSRSFVPTLKENPADAQVASHQLLVRAGFIRQLAAGIYSILPLGQRSLLKITRIIREEMEAIGGQEFYRPARNPREVWEESGRWAVMGENMFRLRDRKGADLCLAMTHEEVFTVLARAELRSYRQLPQTWYQIQTKFRDEPRPKSGLLRVRQFTMKDSYSFDVSREGLDKSFEDHRQAYVNIFGRCGLRTIQVDAHSGAMGGSGSTEFMVPTDAGEDLIASCESCGYAANTEKAESRVETKDRYAAAGASPPLEEFATPGVATIEDLARKPYGVAADQQLKTLVYAADERPVVAIVRGDDQLNEAKLQTATGASLLRPAHPEEIQARMGAKPGSLGGVALAGKNLRVFLYKHVASLARLAPAATTVWVELHHDADGIRMPLSIAPFHLALLPLQMQDAAVREVAEKLYREMTGAGVEVLLDDRDERAGVKFKDADLIGLPLRIAIGKKGLAEGKVEWKMRGANDVDLIALTEVVARVQSAVRDAGGRLSR